MSIRIYNDGVSGAAASEASRAQELSRISPGGKSNSGAAAGGEDQIQISSLSESLAAQGGQRSSRVSELAAAYQSGRYQVDSMDVSRAIVNHALQAGSMEGNE